jgi:hypothetical protein
MNTAGHSIAEISDEIERLTKAALGILHGVSLRHQRETDPEKLSIQLADYRQSMAGIIGMLAAKARLQGVLETLALTQPMPDTSPPPLGCLH